MNNQNTIDELFRQKTSQTEANSMKAKVWQQVQNNIAAQQQPRGRVINLYTTLASIAAILVIALCIFTFAPSEQTQAPVANDTHQTDTTLKLQKAVTIDAPNIATQSEYNQ